MSATKPLYIRGIPDDWHQAIEEEANKDGIYQANVVRSILREGLEKRGHTLSDPVETGGSRENAGRKRKD